MKKVFGLLLVFAVFCTSCKKHEEQLSAPAQLQKDVAAIDVYLRTNGITAIKDSTGLRYAINTLGTGTLPPIGSRIALKIKAVIMSSGTIVSTDTAAIAYDMADLVSGLQIILPKIPKGSTFTAYLPSGLAFGPYGSGDGSIPGNANVILQVFLFDDDAQLIKDKKLIDNYLTSRDIDVLKDSSGLRYVISVQGTGARPVETSNVSVKYVGTLMSSGKVFTQITDAQLLILANLIPAWKIGIPLIQAGGTITLYVPSGLGYGPSGTSDGVIPANSNLIFTIQLISVD